MATNCKHKISVLIVTFNNAHTIIDCIDSLERQSFKDFEVLIKDNNSTDSTLDLIKQYNDIVVCSSRKNEGFASAVNYLSSKANGEYLFMLNPDCICPPETLEILYEFEKNHHGVISPLLVYPDGRLQPSARTFPNYKNILFSRRSPLYRLGLAGTKKAGYIQPDTPAKVQAVSATALFMTKKVFNSVGGFDERFFLYLEDIDLCLRLGAQDVAIWYLPTLKIQHSLGASSSESRVRSIYYHHLSMLIYFKKHFPRNHVRNFILMVLLTAGFLLSSVLEVLKIKKRL
jgi:GT2 family glycosyltransferase